MSAMPSTLAAGKNFLTEEAGINPEGFYCEIVEAMAAVSKLENKRNQKAAHSIWDTLLTCADMVQRMID